MLLSSPLGFIAVLLVCLLIARRMTEPALDTRVSGLWSGPWLPWIIGLIVAAVTSWIWGGLRAPAVVHDEAAYLLQAGIFAHGHWSLPSPPLTAPFTQAAVLVTPALAPKMAPGHALLLVPGIWTGLPGLMPMLLLGAAAGIMAALVRRIAGAPVAVLTVAIWLTQGGQERWRAAYFSETTSGLMWLGAWWCLLRWRESRDIRWIVALAACVGWGAITRPLTMLAFAVPLGVVVLRDVIRLALWRQLGAALLTGLLILMLLPWQNSAITGNARTSALSLYTRQYVPFDRMGFGLDSTPPLITLPADLDQSGAGFRARHAEHQPAALPGILRDRLRVMWQSSFVGWRLPLVVAAFVGLWAGGVFGWFALASAAAVYLAYLGYAHEPYWSLYYAETTPVIAFVMAVGAARVVEWMLSERVQRTVAVSLIAACVALFGAKDLLNSHNFRANEQAPFRAFDRAALAASPTPALIFVRYAPAHDPHASLVRNSADPVHAPYLTAYDFGAAANARLAADFPARRPLLWDESTATLTPVR